MIGSGFSYVASLGVSVIVARWLGKEGFGELGLIQSTIGMLGTLAGMGLGTTATRFVAQLRGLDKPRAGRIISLTSIVSVVAGITFAGVLLSAPAVLFAGSSGGPKAKITTLLGAVLLLLNTVNGNQSGILSGFEAFRDLSRLNVLRGICSLFLTFIGVTFWGINGVIGASVCVSAILCFSTAFVIRRWKKAEQIPGHIFNVLPDINILWRFSIPAMLSGALVGPVMWFLSVQLSRESSGLAELGLFNAANQWRLVITFIPGVLCQPLLSMFANSITISGKDEARDLLRWGLLLTIMASLVIAGPVALFAEVIMRTYGAAFVDGAPVLRLLAMSAVLSSGAASVGQAIAGRGRMWDGFLLNLFWAITLILSHSIFFCQAGAVGIGKAFLVAYACHCFTTAYFVVRMNRKAD